MAALAAATLGSEDLACLGAGLLARAGRISLASAIAGCAAGIAAGDLALWGAARVLGTRLLAWRWIARRIPPGACSRAGSWIGAHLALSVFAARFAPGSRVAFFVLAGLTGQPAGRMALWTVLAALAWTPLIVGAAAMLGEAFVVLFRDAAAAGAAALVACLAGLAVWRILAGPRNAAARGGPRRRSRLGTSLARLRRWEYWPAWAVYLPLVPWIALLSLKHRGFGTVASANPGIPGGGFVGESKAAILSDLSSETVLPFILLPPGDPADRCRALADTMAARGWDWPLVLKPDAGQRGVAVRVIREASEAAFYLRRHSAAVIAQVYHPGPFEAGLFYYRIPGEARGRILSITDKVFPIVIGDGRRALEELIEDHPRHRMQARVYLKRLGESARRVPAAGEAVRLAESGNHCQGTMFRDGERLRTPELEAAVDSIARRHPGFFFGRFDVRYAREEDLCAGRGFGIVELNGVTSESTNIYDPAWSIWRAWGMLARQWALLFRIGAANRRAGLQVTRGSDLLRAALAHRRHPSLGHPGD
jgi:membrane protein DedA with SNARE-associated domain